MLPNIFFAWWNTSLSPVRVKVDSAAYNIKMEIASKVINALVSEGVDFIALTEVNDNDINLLKRTISKAGYKYNAIKGTEKAGKTKFDIGIFYNTQKIDILEQKFLTEKWATNTLKLALKVDISPYAGEKPFSIFISHWPSSLSKITNRASYGSCLRQVIDKTISLSPDKMSYIITMGDFNYEPFDDALSDQLLATRDRVIASRNHNLLYNPFWRHLGERDAFSFDTPVSDYLCGSYFYKKDTVNRWRTFDQIMFSSSFLNSKEWYLDEKYSFIWQNEFFNFETLADYGFDHFPVTSAVIFNPNMEE
jgi:hypothetical protein